ncbi:hypothetical protein [Gordonia sp. (in: high G+C Gram-positive bacteria)]|uniref:hypothetical protein n=1 Tax=Gordonia sp. (in: high G+C Gram-positive bacteria) TaxID=84139 RepID=UPI002621959A|nr:hypothetical protein [Gordonia sp. (in: high G+C Gram-positive bacteria)]
MRSDSNAAALVRSSRRLGSFRVPPGASLRTIVTPGVGPRPPAAITAAAQTLGGHKVDRTVKAPTTERWQQDAWDMRDEIGELRFLVDRQARAVSQVELFVGKAEGYSATPVRSTDPLAVDLQQVLFGSRPGVEQMMYRAAQQMICNGETILHARQDGARIAVFARAIQELQGRPGTWKFSDGVGSPEPVDEGTERIVRCWRPHPQWYGRADAPLRAVLPVARELRGLTQFVSAQIDSRLAGAGLLLVPQEIESMWQTSGNASVDDDGEPLTFAEELTEYFLTPIKDRDSAAAVVPFMATLPADMIDKVKHLTFSTPLDEHAADLRDEAIRRIGLGMDSDPSVLLGQDSGSHWSAWAVDANEIRFGVEPVAAIICHALTAGLLQPILEDQGVADADRWQIWYDPTHLIVRDDRSKDAQALFDKGVLSAAALRRENGFADTDAPDAEEVKTTLIRDLIGTRSDLIDKWLPELGIVIPGITDNAERVDDTLAEDDAPPPDAAKGVAPEAPDGPPVMGETEATR